MRIFFNFAMTNSMQVEDDVKEAIEVWEKDHGQTFLVEGVAFTQYLDNLWTSFRKEKEQEKQERVRAVWW